MEGETLIKTLAEATGLPPIWVEERLKALMAKNGLNPNQVTLSQIREILATFLQDTLLDVKES